MPTVLRHARYRLYMSQTSRRTCMSTKAAALPSSGLSLSASHEALVLPRKDINATSRLVRDHREQLIEAWHEFFGTKNR